MCRVTRFLFDLSLFLRWPLTVSNANFVVLFPKDPSFEGPSVEFPLLTSKHPVEMFEVGLSENPDLRQHFVYFVLHEISLYGTLGLAWFLKLFHILYQTHLIDLLALAHHAYTNNSHHECTGLSDNICKLCLMDVFVFYDSSNSSNLYIPLYMYNTQ